MQRSLPSVLVATLLLAAAGCATAASPAASDSPTAQRTAIPGAQAQQQRVRRDPNRIGREEIEAADQMDVLSLVQAHRPGWLRTRGKTSIRSPEYIQTYRDGISLGGVGVLRQIDTRSVSEIRYLNGIAATQRFGTDHGSGAILVSTRS